MRGLLRRAAEREFAVELTVHRLNSIPVTHRMMFIHWRLARRDAGTGAAHYGFTESRPVEPGNAVTWEAHVDFNARISADPADADALTLQRTPLQLQLRSERRSRIGVPSYNPEGVVEIDLADVAAAGTLNKHFLVQESLLNATLHVSLRMRQISGDKVFRTRNTLLPLPDPATVPADVPAPPPGIVATVSSTTAVPAIGPAPLPPGVSDSSLMSSLPPSTSTRTLMGLRSLDSRAQVTLADRTRSSANGLSRAGSFSRPPSLGAYSHMSSRSADISSLALAAADAAALDRTENEDATADAIKDPEAVQAALYEDLFYQRLRDEWPSYIEESRQSPEKLVEEIYSRICAQDGIKHPIRSSREPSTVGSEGSNWHTLDDQKMTVEGLLESLYR